MLTCLRISLDAMPWRRENRARCKRPADIEVIRVRNGGHMHRLVLSDLLTSTSLLAVKHGGAAGTVTAARSTAT